MDDTKSQVAFMNSGNMMICKDTEADPEKNCTTVYQVIDEHTIRIKVPPQKTVSASGEPIKYQPWTVAMMDMDGEFSNTNIKLYYYNEFQYKNISSNFAYANEEKPLILATDFNWGTGGNEYSRFKKLSNFACRFNSTTTEPATSVVMPAYMEASPIGGYLPQQLPSQVRCRTPRWNNTDILSLEISSNGIDFTGNFQITIVENLKAFRLSPMAGPIEGGTRVKLYGYGYMSSIPKSTDLFVRFGSFDSQPMEKSNVNEGEKWNDDTYHNEL